MGVLRARSAVRLLTGIGALASLLMLAPLTSAETRVVLFDDIEADGQPVPLTLGDERYLSFGNIMFDYYSDRRFAALSGLLVNRKQGLFDVDTEYAELLLGDLYVSFGLPQQGGEIFNRLLGRDILARTRAETWFHKADLHYRQGELDEAVQILESDHMRGLDEEMHARRRLMLANAYMDQEDFSQAMEWLAEVPEGSAAHGYASYNLGVAMIRSGQADQGVTQLASLLTSSSEDEEFNALQDRAALAIGLTELNRDKPVAARQALLNVRADGPFSNEALISLGLANYRRGEIRSALPLWLELVKRNSAHESVQEALILAPQAYEELGAYTQALAGFEAAAERLQTELVHIENLMRNISQSGWLETLIQEDRKHVNRDPMSYLDAHNIARGDEAAYLYQLFSSHRFVELFREFQQLQRLRDLMKQWHEDLPILHETYETRQAMLESTLSDARARLVDISRRQQQQQMAVDRVAADIPMNVDLQQMLYLSDVPNSIMWRKVEQIREHLENRSDEALNERLRRVRGVLMWDIVHHSPQEREKQEADSLALIDDSQIAAVRVAANEQLIRDASLAVQDDLGNRLNAYENRIQQAIQQAESSMQALAHLLERDALQELSIIRRRLNAQLAEAHLGVARVQDAAFVGEQRRSAP